MITTKTALKNTALKDEEDIGWCVCDQLCSVVADVQDTVAKFASHAH